MIKTTIIYSMKITRAFCTVHKNSTRCTDLWSTLLVTVQGIVAPHRNKRMNTLWTTFVVNVRWLLLFIYYTKYFLMKYFQLEYFPIYRICWHVLWDDTRVVPCDSQLWAIPVHME